MKEVMTPREAAEYLNIHVRTIYRLAKNGMIPVCKVGGHWRFSKAALDEWLSEDSAQRRECRKPREPQIQIKSLRASTLGDDQVEIRGQDFYSSTIRSDFKM
jgi:excisionase family DNA binding protein